MEKNMIVEEFVNLLNDFTFEFIAKKKSAFSLLDMAAEGLDYYLKFNKNKYFCSLYLINEATLDFEQLLTLPEDNSDEMKEIYQKLIEEATIGEALRTAKPSYMKVPGNNPDIIYFICLPLLSMKGVLGFIIFKTDFDIFSLEKIILNNLLLFTEFFAVSLENVINYESYRRTHDALDQIVAERTMRLEKSKSRLDEKIELMKQSLTRTLPHEVRTPINQILGNTEFLRSHFSSVNFNEADELLRDIGDSANRLRRLFENYLYYSNLSMLSFNIEEIERIQNEITLSFEDMAIGRIIGKASEYDRKNDLIIDIRDSAVYIPGLLLGKILDEIADNSFKFSEKNTSVHITAYPENENYIIIIRDYGRGMTDEQIRQIDAYMQFQRLVYEQQGMGMGLAIVSKILSLVKGSLKIDSIVGEGSALIIKLNCAKEVDIDSYLGDNHYQEEN